MKEIPIRPRILVFTTFYDPFAGGAEIAVKDVMTRLKNNYRFLVITARIDKSLPKREERSEATIVRIGIGHPVADKFLAAVLGAVVALREIRRDPPALMWVIMISFAGGAAYAANILRFWGRLPILQSLQEGDSEEHLSRARWGLISISWHVALRRASAVHAISDHLKARAQRMGWTGPVSVIGNPVNIERFSIALKKDDRDEIRRSFGLGPEDLFLVTTSRLVRKNGVDILIRAVARLTHLPIKLLIIGDGEMRHELEVLANVIGVSRKIVFAGMLRQDDILRILASADIFCRPSRSEGFGNSFIEAIAAGLPVIAPPIEGIRDFLRDGENGLAVAPEDPEAVASAIEVLMKDAPLRRALRTGGDRTAKAYDISKIAESFDEMFRRIVREAART
jgi:glycosyltransferase involved in cell wall biosynthesis